MKKHTKQIVRIVSILLAVVLLAGPLLLGMEASAAESSPDTVIKTGTTTASYLFIRAGAGTNYKSVGGLWKGTSVSILEESNGWYRISSGWISGQYVAVKSPAPATPSTPTTPSTSTTGNATVTASALNIRKDPSTNYSAVGSLSKGARIQVLESNGNWLKIKEGWVYSAYVKMDDGSTVYTEYKNAVVTANELNIRNGPSLSAQKIGSLVKNQKVEVLETSGDWVRTNYGWVNKNYVKMVSAASANNTGTVTASALNIRSGPGTNYDRLGSLQRGETVTILENKGGWYRISSGWVSANYIKLGG